MDIEFPRTSSYDPDRCSVWFRATVNSQVISCFVTEEALRDHFGLSGRDARTYPAKFEENRAAIESVAKTLILQQRPDSELVLHSQDFS
ncbi:MAG: DUF1488 domain-containing protein [Burkholderiales bacterium]|nr:DUF1488 domain-containing protein [Burkholderiales bacterium]